MTFLLSNQQYQSTEGFHGLDHPKLTWGLPTLSLTTEGFCLPGYASTSASTPKREI